MKQVFYDKEVSQMCRVEVIELGITAGTDLYFDTLDEMDEWFKTVNKDNFFSMYGFDLVENLRWIYKNGNLEFLATI
jgi:hypothetical protein